MKNRIIKLGIWAITVSSIAVTTSCKNYLDIENPSTESESVTFSTLQSSTSAVVGIYSRLAGDNGYGSRLSLSFPNGADDFKIDGDYNALQLRGLSHYGASPGLSDLKNTYLQLYTGIERANMCIKNIPLSDIYNSGSAVEKESMRKLLGEALTLRALFYLELLRNWGDLPARFEPAADIVDQYIGKEDKDIIYDRLLADLEQASELVPWRSQSVDNVPTRVTKAMVKGLRARIALTRGGYSLRISPQMMVRKDDYKTFYEIAKKECWDIIQSGEHGLNPNFEEVFKAMHTNNSVSTNNEVIFAVGAAGAQGATNTKVAYGNGIRQNASSSWGQANGANSAVATYFYEFDKEDIRRDVTLAYYQIDADDNKELTSCLVMREGKFRKYWTGIRDASQNLGVNWPMLRYADILLMYAEAENELNGAAGAREYVKEVRRRAFPSSMWQEKVEDYVNNISDADFFEKAIMQERLLEFGGEGIRKYDLIRWNKLAENITATRNKLRDFRDGVGAYANYPVYIYYRKTPFTNAATVQAELATLDLYGGNVNKVMFEAEEASTPAGYLRVNWRQALAPGTNNVDGERYISGVGGIAHAFIPNARELLPIHNDIVNANFRLTQDYDY